MINLTTDDDFIYITCDGGKLTASILTDSGIEYELSDFNDHDKERFESITNNSSIILIESISVEENSRGMGIAGQLLDKLFKYAQVENFTCLYLNACPILADRGLDLESLTSFYSRRGFDVFLEQKSNVLMIKKL